MSEHAFISYCRPEVEKAHLTGRLLTTIGIPTWLDEREILYGEQFVRNIASGLMQSTLFVLISPQNSDLTYWCNRELQAALRLRVEGRIKSVVVISDQEPCSFHPDSQFDSVQGFADSLPEWLQSISKVPSRVDPSSHQVVMHELHPLFQQRRWLGFSETIQELDDWFFGSTEILWITGIPMSGKTSLVTTWLTALHQLGYRKGLHCDCLFWSFYEQPDVHEARKRLKEREIQDTGPVLAIMDGMERVGARDGQWLCDQLIRLGWRVIVTSCDPPPQPMRARHQIIRLRPMSDLEQRLYLQYVQIPDELKARLIEWLEGNPLLLSDVEQVLKENPSSAMALLDLLNRHYPSGVSRDDRFRFLSELDSIAKGHCCEEARQVGEGRARISQMLKELFNRLPLEEAFAELKKRGMLKD